MIATGDHYLTASLGSCGSTEGGSRVTYQTTPLLPTDRTETAILLTMRSGLPGIARAAAKTSLRLLDGHHLRGLKIVASISKTTRAVDALL